MKLFETLMEKFTLENVRLLMDSVESETNHKFECKEAFLNEYENNYVMVARVLSKVKEKDAEKGAESEIKII